jgi:hypothetical protein
MPGDLWDGPLWDEIEGEWDGGVPAAPVVPGPSPYIPLFRNYLASERRPLMKRFGLMPADQNLSWIPHESDMVTMSLTDQVDGSTNAFTLPVRALFIEQLRWNNAPVYAGLHVPGFSPADSGWYVICNFVPQSGDSLSVDYWPQPV